MIRVLAVTNRNVLRDASGREIGFGDDFNRDPLAGPAELRFAWATCREDGSAVVGAENPSLKGLTDQELIKSKTKAWTPEGPSFQKINYELEIVADEVDQQTGKSPGQKIFEAILKEAKADKSLLDGVHDRWLLFIHGYANTFRDSVESAMRLAYRYRQVRESQQAKNTTINVIVFSWPSYPGGRMQTEPVKAYKQMQQAARISAQAFARLLDLLAAHLIKPAAADRTLQNRFRDIGLSVMCHSLGNLLFQSYVTTAASHQHAGIARRVVLHQADVDEKDHASWINAILLTQDVWITLNRFDVVLRFLSNVATPFNPVNPPRLGQGTDRPEARATYIDCTKASALVGSHNVFLASDQRLKNLCCCLMDGADDPVATVGLTRHSIHTNFWMFV